MFEVVERHDHPLARVRPAVREVLSLEQLPILCPTSCGCPPEAPPDLRIRIPKSEHGEIYKWKNERNISDGKSDIPFAPRCWATDGSAKLCAARHGFAPRCNAGRR
jgi:hypothetical protein